MLDKRVFHGGDRIALYVAFWAMKELGWSSQPELMLDALELHEIGKNHRKYTVIFPLWNNRVTKYKIEVKVESDGSGPWERGSFNATHCTSISLSRQGTFQVKWPDRVPHVIVQITD